jgi:hypothetical protein
LRVVKGRTKREWAAGQRDTAGCEGQSEREERRERQGVNGNWE